MLADASCVALLSPFNSALNFGIIAGAVIFYALGGSAPTPRSSFPTWLLALAGVLVGFGTVLACGCTSGHGL